MAAAMEEEAGRFLKECGICKGRGHRMLQLPCVPQHQLCPQCLPRLEREECPYCREGFEPENIKSVLYGRLKCSVCDSDKALEDLAECVECAMTLCTTCAAFRHNRFHDLFPFQSLGLLVAPALKLETEDRRARFTDLFAKAGSRIFEALEAGGLSAQATEAFRRTAEPDFPFLSPDDLDCMHKDRAVRLAKVLVELGGQTPGREETPIDVLLRTETPETLSNRLSISLQQPAKARCDEEDAVVWRGLVGAAEEAVAVFKEIARLLKPSLPELHRCDLVAFAEILREVDMEEPGAWAKEGLSVEGVTDTRLRHPLTFARTILASPLTLDTRITLHLLLFPFLQAAPVGSSEAEWLGKTLSESRLSTGRRLLLLNIARCWLILRAAAVAVDEVARLLLKSEHSEEDLQRGFKLLVILCRQHTEAKTKVPGLVMYPRLTEMLRVSFLTLGEPGERTVAVGRLALEASRAELDSGDLAVVGAAAAAALRSLLPRLGEPGERTVAVERLALEASRAELDSGDLAVVGAAAAAALRSLLPRLGEPGERTVAVGRLALEASRAELDSGDLAVVGAAAAAALQSLLPRLGEPGERTVAVGRLALEASRAELDSGDLAVVGAAAAAALRSLLPRLGEPGERTVAVGRLALEASRAELDSGDLAVVGAAAAAALRSLLPRLGEPGERTVAVGRLALEASRAELDSGDLAVVGAAAAAALRSLLPRLGEPGERTVAVGRLALEASRAELDSGDLAVVGAAAAAALRSLLPRLGLEPEKQWHHQLAIRTYGPPDLVASLRDSLHQLHQKGFRLTHGYSANLEALSGVPQRPPNRQQQVQVDEGRPPTPQFELSGSPLVESPARQRPSAPSAHSPPPARRRRPNSPPQEDVEPPP